MILTHNDKNYLVKFNIGFIRKLDKMTQLEAMGQQIGISLDGAMNGLKKRDVLMLSNVIYAGLQSKAPTIQEADMLIEAYVEEHGDVESLFEEVIKELGETPVLQTMIKKQAEEVEIDPEEKALYMELIKNALSK